MQMDPILLFNEWYQLAITDSPLRFPGAVCISTIDPEGFPDGRFVDLKDVSDEGFTFCTHLDSAKAQALKHNPKIALTVWWDHIGRQVRVKGIAQPLSEAASDGYWAQRSREAHITTWGSVQSELLESSAALAEKLAAAQTRFQDVPSIPRPANWGGYCIKPTAIEFLTFREDRLHERVRYQWKSGNWERMLLQP